LAAAVALQIMMDPQILLEMGEVAEEHQVVLKALTEEVAAAGDTAAVGLELELLVKDITALSAYGHGIQVVVVVQVGLGELIQHMGG
jgi:hypothetical protein